MIREDVPRLLDQRPCEDPIRSSREAGSREHQRQEGTAPMGGRRSTTGWCGSRGGGGQGAGEREVQGAAATGGRSRGGGHMREEVGVVGGGCYGLHPPCWPATLMCHWAPWLPPLGLHGCPPWPTRPPLGPAGQRPRPKTGRTDETPKFSLLKKSNSNRILSKRKRGITFYPP